MFKIYKEELEVNGKKLTLETGKVARQADGAIIATYGETVVIATTVGAKKLKDGQDYFPLSVNYQEKYYAAGKIPGGYFKREARPTEAETLISRLIDRPIRPLFPSSFMNEVQLLPTVLSYDGENQPDILSIIASSASLAISGLPFQGPIAASRVGYKDGKYLLNPSIEELKDSELDLVVAGTKDAVLMVESETSGLSEKIMLDAVKFGHEKFIPIIESIEKLAKKAGKPKWEVEEADHSKIKTPMLSTANWGGQGLHPRGNFEGYIRSSSEHKWLEAHGIEHWTHFYTDYGLDIQKRFFGYFLKGEDTGWMENQPKVQLQVRHPGEKFVERAEDEWPISRTKWTKYYLHSDTMTIDTGPQASVCSANYQGFSEGLTFLSEPLTDDMEITGPIASKLWISSETEDADLFLVVRAFTPDMKEVTFQGALDPHTPIAQGWLRCSHRKLDEELTLPYRPYHTHDEIQLLTPGDTYEVDVEVWPTCIVVPKGYRLGFSVRGKDYVYPGGQGTDFGEYGEWTGCGLFKHDDPRDRPSSVFGGEVTLHTGPDKQAYVMLPVIPKK